MVRWEPGARERLRAAAMDLYVSRGFEKTTAADIAAAAGLTERSFFRHFADKREVIFAGQEELEQVFLDGLDTAPAGASPMDMVAAALTSAGSFFPEDHRPYSRRRQTIIADNPALHERELLKMTKLAAAVGTALQARGVPATEARLAAQSGLTVFAVAFERWITAGEERPFLEIQDDVLGELVTMVAGATRPA